jgi:hypothetical protein
MTGVIGTSLRCPGCGAFYASIGEFMEAGGIIKSLGLALKATCTCGVRWGINPSWRKRETIIDTPKQHFDKENEHGKR